MQEILKKLKRVLKAIYGLVFNKKTLILTLGLIIFFKFKYFPKEVNSSEFLNLLKSKQLSYVTTYEKNFITFTQIKSLEKYFCHYFIQDMDKLNSELSKNYIPFKNLSKLSGFIENPQNQLFLSISAFSYFTSSYVYDLFKPKRLEKTKVDLTEENKDLIFSDFIAKQETIDNLKMVLKQISNKNNNKKIKPIKGVLLCGKPGTGKTLIARCFEKLGNIHFISTCASDFVEIYVGSGPKKVRELFEEARNSKPAIIFIDELEAVGFQRSQNHQNYSLNIERYSTLNMLLSEMDGLNSMEDIIVIAATNREDLLDSALIRPGRFDVKITIDVPDAEVRYKMFYHYLNKYGYSEEIKDEIIKNISLNSSNVSGAIIESIVNEAARNSYSKDFNDIQLTDLMKSFERNLSEFYKYRQFEFNK